MTKQPIRVLLVEDNPAESRLIGEYLDEAATASFMVSHVDHLTEALGLLAADPPFDIILLDLSLPDSQGIDTLIEANTKSPEIPIVVLTGLDDEETAIRAVQEGAQDYLTKGNLSGDTLCRAIRYAIERTRLEQEHRRLEAQLRQAEKMNAIGQLAGGVAHNFNNTLGAISGYAELLKEHLVSSPKLAYYAERILTAATRAGKDVNHLLTFARKDTVSRRVLKIGDVLEETLEILHRTLDPAITIESEIGTDGVTVTGDANQLINALLNLGINARDAMPGGGTLTVRAQTVELDDDSLSDDGVEVRPGSYVRISVRDTGEGMDRETREHAFEPFYTTKEVGKGTGLGLASVHGCARLHEGYITVRSAPGEGACFDLYIPVWSDAASAPPRQPATVSTDASRSPPFP
jgi:signal transduction histidine kinase